MISHCTPTTHETFANVGFTLGPLRQHAGTAIWCRIDTNLYEYFTDIGPHESPSSDSDDSRYGLHVFMAGVRNRSRIPRTKSASPECPDLAGWKEQKIKGMTYDCLSVNKVHFKRVC